MPLIVCNGIQRFLPFRSKPHLLSSVVNYSVDHLREIKDAKLETARRGTGYRSSFNGITCTVFGASGCIGRAIVNRLGNRGTQVVVPYRSDPYLSGELKTAGDLGQILFTHFHLEDEDSIRKAMKYSDVVINCIGTESVTLNFNLEKVNHIGAERIARIAREMGVKKFIHFSSMGASPNPREIFVKGGSLFMKTKWAGEQAVRREFPDAIIVRPSETYGEFDRFFRYYGEKRTILWCWLFLWKCGMDTVKQPIYVVDVAAGIHELVTRHIDDVKGKTYQFVGPRRYLLHDMVEYLLALMWKTKDMGYGGIEDSRFSPIFPLYRTYFDKCYVNTSKYPFLSWERFEREHTNDDLDPNACLIQDLGVKLNYLETIAPQFTYVFREDPTYTVDTFEFEPPTLRVLEEIK